MNDQVTRIVIVGGGSAGWLTAAIIAAEHSSLKGKEKKIPLTLTLVESPDTPTIGVGEGSWPSMRSSLQKIGVSESDFIRECDASFKQGTRFFQWSSVNDEGLLSDYCHPFSLPTRYSEINLATHWQGMRQHIRFDHAVNGQSWVMERGLAPKQISTPEYAFNLNYGYHLDAGKFAEFLRRHCVDKLGVTHLLANVMRVNRHDDGYIESVSTDTEGDIPGDLFIDCSGFAALLIGKHCGVSFIDKKQNLFCDTALAAPLPYDHSDDLLASCTLSTAREAGWIWDIGLSSRRGVGYVYSSAHCTDEQAEQVLQQYISTSLNQRKLASIRPRKIRFTPGHREKCWHQNCVAVGLSAGFVEPLEASALVLIELSANMISEHLPLDRERMSIVAKRFNEICRYRWNRIVDFLKLHYALSHRHDSDFWRDHRHSLSIPDSLRDSLQLWRHRCPWHQDAPQIDDIFPSASFQYVLYGMGFHTQVDRYQRRSHTIMQNRAEQLFKENRRQTQQLLRTLPTNRELMSKISEFGFQTI